MTTGSYKTSDFFLVGAPRGQWKVEANSELGRLTQIMMS